MDDDERERLRRQRRQRADAAGYENGYGKPPLKTRFSSSNQPQRTRKPRKSLEERVAEIADENVRVKFNGVSVNMPRHLAIVRRLGNDALSGNNQAADKWFKHVASTALRAPPKHREVDYAAQVRRKLEEMVARLENDSSAPSEVAQEPRSADEAGEEKTPPRERPEDE